jgi:hypothetical protein
MSKTMSDGAETRLLVFYSRAEISANDRSCTLTGFMTCELILLSGHYLANMRVIVWIIFAGTRILESNCGWVHISGRVSINTPDYIQNGIGKLLSVCRGPIGL